MSYSAPNRLLMPGRHSIDTLTDSWVPAFSLPSAAAWPSANLGIYVPLRVPRRLVALKLWIASGTTGTDNVDMALYDAAGAAIISATGAAKTAASTEMVFDVTDTTLGPGLYYLAASCDSATATFTRFSMTAPGPAAIGVLTEASAYPLPSTATWALDQTLAYIPIMGVLVEGTVA